MFHKTLKGVAAVAVALGMAGAAQAGSHSDMVDGPAVTWNHSIWGKPRAFTTGLEFIAAELDRRTGGKFQLKLS